MTSGIPTGTLSARERAQLIQAKRKRLLKMVGMLVSAGMVLAVSIVLFLIFRTESAHDEATCLFIKSDQRELNGTRVIEESRRCLPELEERRYLVARVDKKPFELARKRLPASSFAPERFKWTLREDKAHKLIIRFDVDGKMLSEFFEEDTRPQ